MTPVILFVTVFVLLANCNLFLFIFKDNVNLSNHNNDDLRRGSTSADVSPRIALVKMFESFVSIVFHLCVCFFCLGYAINRPSIIHQSHHHHHQSHHHHHHHHHHHRSFININHQSSSSSSSSSSSIIHQSSSIIINHQSSSSSSSSYRRLQRTTLTAASLSDTKLLSLFATRV
jgi:hypothetical protein